MICAICKYIGLGVKTHYTGIQSYSLLNNTFIDLIFILDNIQSQDYYILSHIPAGIATEATAMIACSMNFLLLFFKSGHSI